MNENAGKSPDRIENPEWQSRPKPGASQGVAEDFALASAAAAMTSSSADTPKSEPSQAGPEPARDAILPRSLRLAMMAVPLGAAAALGAFLGSLTAGGVTQFWPRVAPISDAQASNVELAALSAPRHTSKARLETPTNSSPRWPIASTGSSARRPNQM